MQNSLITKHYYSIIFLLVFHTFSFAQKSLAPDSVAVQVNGTAIYERNVSDKMQTLIHLLKKHNSRKLNTSSLQKVRGKVLNKLIYRRILITTDKAKKIIIPDDDFDKHMKTIIETKAFGSLPRYKAYLANQKISWEAWQEETKESLIISRIKEEFAAKYSSPKEYEIKKKYKIQKDDFFSGGRIKISLMVLDPEDSPTGKPKDFALGVQNAVYDSGPEAWDSYTKKYSVGPYADKKGQWEWTNASDLPFGFSEIIKSMHLGDIRKISHGQYFYFLRFDEVEQKTQLSFNDAKNQIKEFIIKSKTTDAWNAWVKKKMNTAKVKVL
jgi:peptidyl-prolyl cis-trans isomerase SurA